jgi:hypothetical protein
MLNLHALFCPRWKKVLNITDSLTVTDRIVTLSVKILFQPKLADSKVL